MANRAAVLYHYPCPDGVFAALAAHLYHAAIGSQVTFFPNTVYSPIKAKDLDGDKFDVFYLLDYCGPEGFAVELSAKTKQVIILDHHKTSYEALGSNSANPKNLITNFDMKRSGATIAYDYFTEKLRSNPACQSFLMPEKDISRVRRIFEYIEDADLWNWRLPNSKAFSSGLRHLNIEYNVNSNPTLFEQLLQLEPSKLMESGELQLMANQAKIDTAIESCFVINLGSGKFGQCLAVHDDNVADIRSDLGNQLAAKSLAHGLRPIGAIAYGVEELGPSMLKVSLRALEGDDSTEISQAYDGGGHRGASSFLINKETFDTWRV